MKDIDVYVTKDNLYRLVSNIKRNPDIVVDDKTCDITIKAISDMPVADVQPVKHGQWKTPVSVGNGIKFCSVCRNEAYWDTDYGQQLFDYCPYCGARMDLKDGDEE